MSVVPTKKEVAAAIVRAGTPQEIEAARELRETYLRAHPDDDDILGMGETLSLLEELLAANAQGKPRTHDGVTESKRQ